MRKSGEKSISLCPVSTGQVQMGCQPFILQVVFVPLKQWIIKHVYLFANNIPYSISWIKCAIIDMIQCILLYYLIVCMLHPHAYEENLIEIATYWIFIAYSIPITWIVPLPMCTLERCGNNFENINFDCNFIYDYPLNLPPVALSLKRITFNPSIDRLLQPWWSTRWN